MGLFLIYPLTGRLANRLKLDSARMQLVSTQERGSIPLRDFILTKKRVSIINDEQLSYLKHLYETTTYGTGKITEKMNQRFPGHDWAYENVRSKIRNRVKKGEIVRRDDVEPMEKESSIKKTTGEYSSTVERMLITTDELENDSAIIKKFLPFIKFPDNYTLELFQAKEYNVYSKQDGIMELKSTNIKVKPKIGVDSIDWKSILAEEIEPVKLSTIKSGKRNLVIPLADWHFGITKLSDVMPKLTDMIEIISKGYDQIVILQLGDLFHSSQIKKSVTMNETRLDDVDMEQAVRDCRTFFDMLISECVRHSKQVSIEHAEGNHSGNLEYMFLVYLEAKYPDVKVNYHNKYRTAFALNSVGFFITHGQYAKRKDLPMLFATEYPNIWSDSVSREIFSGHFHTLQTQDYNGVVHRQLGTIKANDDYEIQNGWTMNKKVVQLFEYDENQLRVTYDI